MKSEEKKIWLTEEEKGRRNSVRSRDRRYFESVLSDYFISNKDVHHEWENPDETCYLLEKFIHREWDNIRYERQWNLYLGRR